MAERIIAYRVEDIIVYKDEMDDTLKEQLQNENLRHQCRMDDTRYGHYSQWGGPPLQAQNEEFQRHRDQKTKIWNNFLKRRNTGAR